MRHLFVIVPTFKETDKIRELLSSFYRVQPQNTSLLIVNANFGDETTRLIEQASEVAWLREIAGQSSLYWSGLVNLGLEIAACDGDETDFIILMNADVTFDSDVLTGLKNAADGIGKCQLGALTHSGGRVISSGVQVRSWLLALTRHPFAGMPLTAVPVDYLQPVDYLPTRCVLLPLAPIRTGLRANEKLLPHYAADYELTHRLKQLGYFPYIYTGVWVECDVRNTGNNVFVKSGGFRDRVRKLFFIKSAYNPVTRIRFVWIVFPWYAKASAILIYSLKSLLELILGGRVIRAVVSHNERGFS